MQYRSIADLNRTVLAGLHQAPRDIDLVIGIPRSGILPASLIALAFNLPLADVEGFVDGRTLAAGRTKPHPALFAPAGEIRHVLLVDDSVQTGTSMREARRRLSEHRPDVEVTSLAVYGVHGFDFGADIILERVGEPRVFQWNVMHHKVLGSACVDIDGVLCVDPTHRDNDDGENYLRFLETARPFHRPTRPIHTLVTSRLEKYRDRTEAWLRANGVEYDRLVMLDLPDAAARRAAQAHGPFKAAHYAADAKAKLFIESDAAQAREIAQRSSKPVLWLNGAEMFYRDGAPAFDGAEAAARAARRGVMRAKEVLRDAVGEARYDWLRRAMRSPRRFFERRIGA